MQEPGVNRVELADVPEPERAQERAEHLRCVDPGEQLAIPPCRSTARSSMESAPATIPATNEATFAPALAPLSLGTLNNRSARSASPAPAASRITGTSPADPMRFGSSNTADVPFAV